MGATDTREFDLAAAPTDMRFRSALSASALMQGQRSFYVPVATGPGREIRYAAASGAEAIPLANGRLALATESPGEHVVEVTAEDELGNQARQLLSYQVMPRPGLLQNLSLSARGLGGTSVYDARYRLGRSRFGVLRAGPWDTSLPFLFVGFDPVPEAYVSRHSLFLDLGCNAQGNSGITYGGLMARLEGRYGRFGADALVFQYGAHYHARQAILLVDPSDYRHNDLGDSRLEKCMQDLRSRTDRADSLMAGFLACDDGAREMLDAYGSGNNEVFLLESALWLHLGYAVYGGPVYRVEDHFHARGRFSQRLGLGLARSAAFGAFAGTASARAGFSPQSPVAEFLFDLTLRFGRDE
jgi:hypothetical protein